MSATTDRIRKLLAKANDASCTQEEAASFMAAVTRMLIENNLDLQSVYTSNPTGETLTYDEESIFTTGRWLLSHSLAASICKEFCFVESYLSIDHSHKRDVKSLVFFGTKENIASATFMFAGLLAAFDNLFLSYRRYTCCAVQEKNNFIRGVASGFKDKMHAEQSHTVEDRDKSVGITQGSTALAVIDIKKNTKAAYNSKHSELRTYNSNFARGSGNMNTRNAGYAAGQRLNINRGIDGSNRGALE